MNRCLQCLGEVPYRGGPIPVVRCDCGNCACVGCENRRRLKLGIPETVERSANNQRSERLGWPFHRVTLRALFAPGESVGASAGAVALRDGIKEVLGLHSTAGLVRDVRVEWVDSTNVVAHVSALVPVDTDGYGQTPDDAANSLLVDVDDAFGNGSSDEPLFWLLELVHVTSEPERGCTRCFSPPYLVTDVDEHGHCPGCQADLREQQERQERVDKLLANWRPGAEPTGAATAYGHVVLDDGRSYRGLIREIIRDGTHHVLLVRSHGSTERVALGTDGLAKKVVDFEPTSRFCGHGVDWAEVPVCRECSKGVKMLLDGLWRRPVH